MTVALSASVIILAALVFLMLGSQVEMYRNIEQLREYSGLIDKPVLLSLPAAGSKPSSYGLPDSLDAATFRVVLLLSDKCATCRSIAASLHGSIPDDLTVVVESGYTGEDTDLGLSYELDPDRTLVDATGRVSRSLGIRTTPAAVVIENGVLTRALTVPSSRQLDELIGKLRESILLESADPAGGKE